uniref:Uncharacterized protein n=1 Tax=viral metagenome TaxID=1070528 RepID=A0A6C0KX91_9ZZZZ
MKYPLTTIALVLVVILIGTAFLKKYGKEPFAASQGGVLVQLMSSHVASEEEVRANMEYEKRRVAQDIREMTEPDSRRGPVPLPF